jgi:hypothetical protein
VGRVFESRRGRHYFNWLSDAAPSHGPVEPKMTINEIICGWVESWGARVRRSREGCSGFEGNPWLLRPTGSPPLRSGASPRREMYEDGGGLYLQVSAGGAKSWIFRFMPDGRAREMGLGPLHTIPLAEARKRAAERAGCVLTGLTR